MDIVERLRKVFGVVVKADDCFEEDYSVAREAADEIERLRQQNAELTIDPNIKMLLAGKKALYRLIEDPTFDDARAVYMAMVAANKATGGE